MKNKLTTSKCQILTGLAIVMPATLLQTAGAATVNVGDRTFSCAVVDIEAPATVDGSLAFYDAATGDVIIAIGAGAQGLGVTRNVTPWNTANLNQSTALGVFQQVEPGGIGILTFNPTGFPAGVYNLGQLLPANNAVTNGASFDAAFGPAALELNTGLDAEFIVIPSVPEPGSLSLLALAGLGAIARRRRR